MDFSYANRVHHLGRRKIFTDETEINVNNVRKVVADAQTVHDANVVDIKLLFDTEKGYAPLVRDKEVRPEIDIHAIDSLPAQIVDFKLGYEHGEAISYIQRAKVDCENPEQSEVKAHKDDMRIVTLNEIMRETKKASRDNKMARDLKICGVGYRFISPRKNIKHIAPFDVITLNPMNTFVVYANDVYCEPLCAVTFTVNTTTTNKKYGVWSRDYYFEFETQEPLSGIKVTPNPLGLIPIIEYINNEDRMGCFEKQMPLIDALNVLTSDRINDVCQTVQSILWLHNTKLDETQKGQLVNGGVIQTSANADGKDAKIQYVSAPLNQTEMQTLANSLADRIKESAGVPKQGGKGENTTGEAQKIVTGWHIAETQAKTSELTWRESEDATLEVCLKVIELSDQNPNDIKSLRLSDIDYDIHRVDTYDISSRVNSFVTLTNAGCDITKSALYCKITDDPLQFAKDSEQGINKLRFSEKSENDVPDNKAVESIQPDTVLDK